MTRRPIAWTGGLPGYNSAAYREPAAGVTVVAFVTTPGNKPDPGVANSILRDVARIVTPGRVPYLVGAAGSVPNEASAAQVSATP